MIKVLRPTHHADLDREAAKHLPILRSLGYSPGPKDIDGYQVAGESLWRAQHLKCCYCEHKIFKKFNDVEHYRPKARAVRTPGCGRLDGYWWLAYSLTNLLFACPDCNRSEKNDLFPLQVGSTSLSAEQTPPGLEQPLLLDPAGKYNPVEHIEFSPFQANRIHRCSQPLVDEKVIWLASPRDDSVFGRYTIDVVGLNRPDLIDMHADHVRREVKPRAKELVSSLESNSQWLIEDRMNRALSLLKSDMPFSALSFDALRALVPSHLLAKKGLMWPKPVDIGIQ